LFEPFVLFIIWNMFKTYFNYTVAEYAIKGEKTTGTKSLSPRSREAGNSSCATLMQGITEIGTQRAMKNHGNALHEADFALGRCVRQSTVLCIFAGVVHFATGYADAAALFPSRSV
jgi:hypothetical protein